MINGTNIENRTSRGTEAAGLMLLATLTACNAQPEQNSPNNVPPVDTTKLVLEVQGTAAAREATIVAQNTELQLAYERQIADLNAQIARLEGERQAYQDIESKLLPILTSLSGNIEAQTAVLADLAVSLENSGLNGLGAEFNAICMGDEECLEIVSDINALNDELHTNLLTGNADRCAEILAEIKTLYTQLTQKLTEIASNLTCPTCQQTECNCETKTVTPTATALVTPGSTITVTRTGIPNTSTPTRTPTHRPIYTPTMTKTPVSYTRTPTATSTRVVTLTTTPGSIPQPTYTETPGSTSTPIVTVTPEPQPSYTSTPDNTATPDATVTRAPTPTRTPEPQPSYTPEATDTPIVTVTKTSGPSETPQPTPDNTPTPEKTPTLVTTNTPAEATSVPPGQTETPVVGSPTVVPSPEIPPPIPTVTTLSATNTPTVPEQPRYDYEAVTNNRVAKEIPVQEQPKVVFAQEIVERKPETDNSQPIESFAETLSEKRQRIARQTEALFTGHLSQEGTQAMIAFELSKVTE